MTPETKNKINEDLCLAAKAGDIAKMKELLQAGANIDFKSPTNGNPLFNAAYHDHIEAVKILLDYGANINIKNSKGATPLIGAADKGALPIIELLLEHGADPDTSFTHEGKTYTAETWAALKSKRAATFLKECQHPETVTLTRPLSNLTLEEIYDFERKERISLLRENSRGNVQAMTRDPFAAIETDPGLREAFNLHVKRGGKTDERELFAHVVGKQSAPRKNI